MTVIPPSNWRYHTYAYALVLLCWVAYTVLTLTLPLTTASQYNLTTLQMTLLRLTIIIPVLIIWLVAIRGAVSFKHYATLIKGGTESKGIARIASGLMWVVASLVVSSLLSAVNQHFTGAPSYGTLVIIRDHITPIFSLIAFILIYQGSHRLRDVAQFSTWTRGTFLMLGIYCIFAFLFVLEFSSSQLSTGSGANRTAAAFLPQGVLLFTLILPYLVGWFFGILATINIVKYTKRVKGTIYKRALRWLTRGLWTVIAFSIAMQILTFVARYLTGLSLGKQLLIVYLLLVFYGLGFFFVRAGAKKLSNIEVAQ
jgi:hypothetical protein